ncbi:MAG: transcription-repair coupling factor [Candidatus Aminicenantia bacterium]
MLFNFFLENKQFKKLIEQIKHQEKNLIISGLNLPAKGLFLSALVKELNKKIVLIQPSSSSLPEMKRVISSFFRQFQLDSSKIHLLPPFSAEPYENISPSLESISQRMEFFYHFKQNSVKITITNLFGLLKPLPNPSLLERSFIKLNYGDKIDRDELINELDKIGYSCQDLVNYPGEYAWRGGIIDIFSLWVENPYRIEFSGDEIISLREFSSSTQRSIKKVSSIIIPSLYEFYLNEEFLTSWQEKTSHKWKGYPFRMELEKISNSLRGRKVTPSFFYLAHIAEPFFVSFRDYFQDYIFIFNEPQDIEKEWKTKKNQWQISYQTLHNKGEIALSPEEIFDKESLDKLNNQNLFLEELTLNKKKNIFPFNFQDSPNYQDNIKLFIQDLKKVQEKKEKVVIFISNQTRLKKTAQMLEDYQIKYFTSIDSSTAPIEGRVMLTQGELPVGFCFPEEKTVFLSEKDIIKEIRLISAKPSLKPWFSNFRDLKEGDYVVHIDHGIGIFKGLKELKIEGKFRELIEIMYRDGDRLYVPVERLDLIQKYSGAGEEPPAIDKLGGVSWEKTKNKVKKVIQNMARELLELYAKRKSIKKYPFSPDTPWQKEFEDTFPFEETEDQLKAIEKIKKDMEASCPMDRLLCGDVGYGKTEVAIRAAVKAVLDGKQVALLCPTTVLASQHWSTFKERLAMFPIRVEALTRFQFLAQQKKIITDLKKGLVDIIIGTHRLLSKDVEFKNLGLLVIDEEQRFGVSHKEKIKKIKANIDVLTMTATPIPRTLNMAFYGLRDLSLIETPPKDRLAVHTVVSKFSKELISSAIEKELNRGGQVYFVHNRIEDIDSVSNMISNLVPQAKVTVIHGQMPSRKIEKNMIDFIQEKHNVLVSTTIIENGIDIPLVNTLIVNQAHQFGLAQLYQLRGRVGRSSRQAFAYFLVPSELSLPPVARKRLKALQEFTQLGSGFRLASKDLEIRGAGNLLGSEQHGHLQAVGFDYYLKLLDQTIKELKGEEVEEFKTEINLKVDIRIPENYIPQVNQRLNLYQRISSINSLEEIKKIKEEMEDRFGSLPDSCENILDYGITKFLSEKLKILNIDREAHYLTIKFSLRAKINPEKLILLFKYYKGSFSPEGILKIELPSREDKAVLKEVKYILQELS